MVSDFFFPGLGGVESHILHLSARLIEMGLKVVAVTNARADRQGVRWLTTGLKIYYLPFPPAFDHVTFPSTFCFLPFLREILIREEIDIIHGHQATSNLAIESMIHGKLLGCRAVFTDHSLFGFAELGGIQINKLLELNLASAHRVICVSHTARENLVLRANLDPSRVATIPNALESDAFRPDISQRSVDGIRIVVVSRMTARKGIALLARVVPIVCSHCPKAEFIIGGDGPLRLMLEEMRERERLDGRVHLLGSIPHDEVVSVLRKGDIFLNCSLTEAFCIAILEAASCGMRVVSTDVGGIPEVLPAKLIILCPPDAEQLAKAVLAEAVKPRLTAEEVWLRHEMVKSMYSWPNVAERTIRVYDKAMSERAYSLPDQLHILAGCGMSGKLWALMTIFDALLLVVLEFFRPRYMSATKDDKEGSP